VNSFLLCFRVVAKSLQECGSFVIIAPATNLLVKDRLGDLRGGSEWEPIKILLQRENSAYAPNSQPRIPTRVCQGHIVTTDLPTKDSHTSLPRSASSGRTVRMPTADRPRGSGELSEKDSQTSNTTPTIMFRPWRHLGLSATNTPHADYLRTPGGPSAKPPATEDGWKT
jgi:hypothetical protein